MHFHPHFHICHAYASASASTTSKPPSNKSSANCGPMPFSFAFRIPPFLFLHIPSPRCRYDSSIWVLFSPRHRCTVWSHRRDRFRAVTSLLHYSSTPRFANLATYPTTARLPHLSLYILLCTSLAPSSTACLCLLTHPSYRDTLVLWWHWW
jgi:hypothetical protein